MKNRENPSVLRSICLFVWSCFLKPHAGDAKRNQQDALESFYKGQAGAYDATRKTLLKGREDMLALAAAQILYKVKRGDQTSDNKRRIWIDIGGGTGWNIEAMSQYIDVPQFFDSVYLVDFSPSLCEVARKRFTRLGWKNVKVICQDARKFRLEDHEPVSQGKRSPSFSYFTSENRPEYGGADLITMSYSLSMIPDYYSVLDSVPCLLAPTGIFGVIDFYVQSAVDVSFRNYTGGLINRHVNFFGRTFWRAWFDIDRVSLEPGRRDYLEYRFGTVLNVNSRNYVLGAIPYYIWLGAHKRPFSSSLPHEIVERVDALVTESPYLRPENSSNALSRAVERAAPEIRSKAFDAAIANLSSNLPLPTFFYQNHHYRIYYDDQLKKHTQFNDEYIYAFTWEDTRVDERILKLKPDDVVLAITSAGDNILSYALQGPARIHAVDLNPTQNHLLELKVAAYSSLPYEDFWKIFGDGKHPEFRSLLVSEMSPHLSSRAFQYWLSNEHIFTKHKGGLYDTGGSKHAIRIFRWISRVFGCRSAVKQLLAAKTLNEQREVWRNRIRPALLSRLVSKFVVSQEAFLWTALGVPKNQLAIIEADHATSDAVCGSSSSSSSSSPGFSSRSSSRSTTTQPRAKNTRSHAIWEYMVSTLDPVVESTHVAADNPYYLVCLDGQFSRRCHPDYLSKEAHGRLSRPGALDGLRIHTDEIDEVIARVAPGTLTVAVVMDSMDWFDPGSGAAVSQITKLNRALKMGGRVLLRSAGLRPWYVDEFERRGFVAKCHGARRDGACIDRVNMYASCWIMTKRENIAPPTPEPEAEDVMSGPEVTSLEI
ncbi:putative 3-amino-3-carboxypropyl transferase protein [Eutypa lata UCREL1]|uniref:Putative 3-amino-3-carboxypropyl transferase protein n=1 Tax=Eutypa lata (strain UCR-EL1) TaxID=1287681 RepID=M7TII9_EUTLA|nr:putative 3-amino-3-carboxypropyl transferase protein [Eutypa lata UCREL1]